MSILCIASSDSRFSSDDSWQLTRTRCSPVNAGALAAHDEREVLSRQIEALTAEIRQIREALRKD